MEVNQSESNVIFIKASGMDLAMVTSGKFPRLRTESVQAQSPVKLELIRAIPGDGRLARKVQRILEPWKSHSNWFKVTDQRVDHLIYTAGAEEIRAM